MVNHIAFPEVFRDVAERSGLDASVIWTRVVSIVAEERAETEAWCRKTVKAVFKDMPLATAAELAFLALRAYPHSFALHCAHAFMAMDALDNDEAAERWQDVRKLFPNKPRGYIEGALSLRFANRPSEAAALLVEAQERFPDNERICREAMMLSQYAEQVDSWECAVRGEADNALEAFNVAVSARNISPRCLASLSFSLERLLRPFTPTAGEPPYLPSPEPQNPPRLAFICGYGWSGSTAAADYLHEFEGVSSPFAGEEFFCIAEQFGLSDLVNLVHKWEKVSPDREEAMLAVRRFLLDFFYSDIVGFFPPQKVIENGTARLAYIAQLAGFMNIFGRKKEFENICAVFADFTVKAGALVNEGCKKNRAVAAIARELAGELAEALYRMLCRTVPSGTEWIILDNAVHADALHLLGLFPGRKAAVVVRRDPRDQSVSWSREAWRMGKPTSPELMMSYYAHCYRQLSAFIDSSQRDTDVADVRFADFVNNASLRSKIAAFLGLSQERHKAVGDFFLPQNSAKRIGLYRSYPDQDIVTFMERAMNGTLAQYAGNPSRLYPAAENTTSRRILRKFRRKISPALLR